MRASIYAGSEGNTVVQKEAQRTEALINSCMVQVLSADARFNALDRLLGLTLTATNSEFSQAFDKKTLQKKVDEFQAGQGENDRKATLTGRDTDSSFQIVDHKA